MWKCFAEVMKRDDDDGLERKVESTQKENEAAKDRVIRTFKAEHEKQKGKKKEEANGHRGAREGFEWEWRDLRRHRSTPGH